LNGRSVWLGPDPAIEVPSPASKPDGDPIFWSGACDFPGIAGAAIAAGGWVGERGNSGGLTEDCSGVAVVVVAVAAR